MFRVGAGALGAVAEELSRLAPTGVVVVADARAAELYGPPAPAPLVPIPPGEACKSVAEWSRVIDRFVALGLDRGAVVVAFGGGAALDLAGFAAATYLRGVRWIAVPTTLLAQVDAAHGGKTGIDHLEAKNLVGAFHPPEAVVADTDLLRTLPRREVRSGLAEVVKHGVIGAPELLQRVGREAPAAFVEEAARVKIAIVARDPSERGERAVLNLGHTLGHAIERASGYALAHGEAVAVGLRAACAIAERHCGFAGRAEVEAALDRCELPARVLVDRDAARAALRHDKKRAGARLRLALPVALGDVRLFDDVPEALVESELLARTGG
jgi:3-dehydroquinate synthetase